MLSTFSRLLIDPNRGADDPTLVMRLSDGAIVPGNARIDAAEIERRRRLLSGRPIATRSTTTVDAMSATGRAAGDRVDPFLHAGLARRRAALEGRRALGHRSAAARAAARRRSPPSTTWRPSEVGDNEPYDGALAGDTIDDDRHGARPRQRLIEVRQDLIATEAGANAWADRLAGMLTPIIAQPELREAADFGSRARANGVIGGLRG